MLVLGNIYDVKCFKEYQEGSIPLNVEGCAFTTGDGRVRFISGSYYVIFNTVEESMEYLKYEKDTYYARVSGNGIDVEDAYFNKPSHLTAGSEVQAVEYLNAPTELKPLLDLARTLTVPDARDLTNLVKKDYSELVFTSKLFEEELVC